MNQSFTTSSHLFGKRQRRGLAVIRIAKDVASCLVGIGGQGMWVGCGGSGLVINRVEELTSANTESDRMIEATPTTVSHTNGGDGFVTRKQNLLAVGISPVSISTVNKSHTPSIATLVWVEDKELEKECFIVPHLH